MANWREQKRKALGDIHRTFEIPAVYLTHLGADPVPVRVRLHRKSELGQAVEGEDWGAGVFNMIQVDRIIFKASEVGGMVMSSAYVIFGEREGYLTDSAYPERDGYIPIEVRPLTASEISNVMGVIDSADPAWVEVL